MRTQHETPRHTDSDYSEPKTSTGAQQTTSVCHAVYGLSDPEPVATTDSDSRLHVGQQCVENGDITWADLPGGQLAGDVAPEVSTDRPRFYAFDTQHSLVSNEKSQDSDTDLTRLTHLTSNRRGCTWRAPEGARSRVLGLLDTPLSVGVKSVKRVKYPTQPFDSSFTYDVKSGVNLTPTAVSGWFNE